MSDSGSEAFEDEVPSGGPVVYYSSQATLGRFRGSGQSKPRSGKPRKPSKGQRDAAAGVVEDAMEGEGLKTLIDRGDIKASIQIEYPEDGKGHPHTFPGKVQFYIDPSGKVWLKLGKDRLERWCMFKATLPRLGFLERGDGNLLVDLQAEAPATTPAVRGTGSSGAEINKDVVKMLKYKYLHSDVRVTILDDPPLTVTGSSSEKVYVDEDGYGWVTSSLTTLALFAKKFGDETISGPVAAKENDVSFSRIRADMAAKQAEEQVANQAEAKGPNHGGSDVTISE